MARVSKYLNFARNTEEAFNFYKSIFGGEFSGGGIIRFKDAPPAENMPPLAEEDKELVMHVELQILGSHTLMGTDAPASMGFNLNFGNNISINLEPDTRTETNRLSLICLQMELSQCRFRICFGELTLEGVLINLVYNGC